MIIAIDGPSGTGKSTVAKEVARRLGFTFFDTGAMYRSFAWFIVQKKCDPANEVEVVKSLSDFHYRIQNHPLGERRYFVGEQEVTQAIREAPISHVASQVAIYPQVRKSMVKIQREFGKSADAVFEGRDMGSVVFPNAELKIFLTARLEIRGERRFQELLKKFPDLAESLDMEQVQKEIAKRDETDQNRAVSPLKQASDAILIDTSDLTVSQVVSKILHLSSEITNCYPRKRFLYGFIYWLVRGYFKVFFRLKIHGLHHYRRGSGIIAANHNSNLDPNVVSISCPEEVHFLAKESLFSIPLLGKLIRNLNSHPVFRGAGDTQTFKTILQLLQQGYKVILFPEGKRSFDGNLQPIERGLSFLVQKSKATIFPVYVQGTFEAWPRLKKFPKPFGKIILAFGSPIEWEEFEGLEKKEAEKEITEKMGRAWAALKKWVEDGAQGTTP